MLIHIIQCVCVYLQSFYKIWTEQKKNKKKNRMNFSFSSKPTFFHHIVLIQCFKILQTKGNQQSSPPPPISFPLSISLNLQSICFISWCQPSSGCMTCDLCKGDLSRAHRMSGQHPSQKHVPLCVFSFYQSVQYALHLMLPLYCDQIYEILIYVDWKRQTRQRGRLQPPDPETD